MTIITVYALTMPPSPMLYRRFRRRSDALVWQAWCNRTLPCRTIETSI